jgi:hypothetical protein
MHEADLEAGTGLAPKRAARKAEPATLGECEQGDIVEFPGGPPAVRGGHAPSSTAVVAFLLAGSPFVRFRVGGTETFPVPLMATTPVRVVGSVARGGRP